MKSLENDKMTDDYDEQRKRERARRYLFSVSELNQLIVREFKSSTNGFSEEDVVNRFPEIARADSDVYG